MAWFPSQRPSFRFPSGKATGTIPVKLQLMVKNPETLLAGNPGLQLFDGLALEFYDLSAKQTDEMVMMPSFRKMLKTRHPFPESTGRSPSALRHQLQGTVNGGVTDLGILMSYPLVKLIDTQMGTTFQKNPRDLVALPGGLEPALSQ